MFSVKLIKFTPNYLMLLMLGFLFSCNNSEAQVQNPAYRVMLNGMYKNTVPLISVKDAGSDSAKQYVFLDAREENEYEVSHLKNARWVGYNDFTPDRISNLAPDTPIIVYCSVGYRSERIGEQLLALGYNNVHNLYGGIFEWSNQKQPVVDSTNQSTHKIHAYSKTWGVWLNGNAEKVYK